MAKNTSSPTSKENLSYEDRERLLADRLKQTVEEVVAEKGQNLESEKGMLNRRAAAHTLLPELSAEEYKGAAFVDPDNDLVYMIFSPADFGDEQDVCAAELIFGFDKSGHPTIITTKRVQVGWEEEQRAGRDVRTSKYAHISDAYTAVYDDYGVVGITERADFMPELEHVTGYSADLDSLEKLLDMIDNKRRKTILEKAMRGLAALSKRFFDGR